MKVGDLVKIRKPHRHNPHGPGIVVGISEGTAQINGTYSTWVDVKFLERPENISTMNIHFLEIVSERT